MSDDITRYPYYNIRNLEDILSKFRAELNAEIIPLTQRIEALESKIGQGVGVGVSTRGLTEEDLPLPIGEMEVGMSWMEEKTADDWRATYVEALAARRALYGYAMLADSLGLPKDMREHVRQLESITSGVIRLMQTIRILEAVEAGTIWGPWGWVLAGGTLAATFVYSARVGGG